MAISNTPNADAWSSRSRPRWSVGNRLNPRRNPGWWHVDGGFTLYIGGTQAKHNAKLSAVRGTYDDEAGRLEAWEEVVLVNEEGERLETEHLIWSHDFDLVRTNRPWPSTVHKACSAAVGSPQTTDLNGMKSCRRRES